MGQRLNIEIKKADKVLANCYYHWSAYSNASVNLALEIIKDFKYVEEHCIKDPVTNKDVLFAIRLLERTGAGLQEIEQTRAILGNEFLKLPLCKGRNEGIIRNNRKRYEGHKRLGRGKNNNRY